jgi:hypothetical protein
MRCCCRVATSIFAKNWARASLKHVHNIQKHISGRKKEREGRRQNLAEGREKAEIFPNLPFPFAAM